MQESGIVVGLTNWTSGLVVICNIPESFAVGVCSYSINFTDDYGNFITDSFTSTIETPVETPEGGISYDNSFLMFIGLSVIFLIFAKKFT